MLAIAAPALMIAVACAAPTSLEPLQVDLDFGATMPSVASRAVAEAARIWTRYQVAVRSGSGAAGHIVVRVTIADRAPSTAPDPRAIGAIEFQDGVPAFEIHLYEQRAWELICSVEGTAVRQWPISYRELMLGRVLGRALAHELGHFLLRSPRHSSDGLMRGLQMIGELMAENPPHLFLTADDLRTLTAIRCGPPGINRPPPAISESGLSNWESRST